MASSPPSRDPAQVLLDVGYVYQQAQDAVTNGDLEMVAVLIDKAESSLAELGNTGQDVPDGPLREVRTAHNDLCAVLSAARDKAKEQLHRASHGKRVLSGYSGRSASLGNRHVSDL